MHPIDKLAKLGGVVTDERWLESLYFVRYITDEQVYAPKGVPVRVNDIVGYPIYISAYPPTGRPFRGQVRRITQVRADSDGPFYGDVSTRLTEKS